MHLGHWELSKTKALVALSLHMLCHKQAGSPWLGHLTSLEPSSHVRKLRGLHCLISKWLPPLACCGSVFVVLDVLDVLDPKTYSYISWGEMGKGKELGASSEDIITESGPE